MGLSNSSRLFIACLADGLSVFNVNTNKLITTVENSVGTNVPLVHPEYNRVYTAMTDDSLLSVDLKTLKTYCVHIP